MRWSYTKGIFKVGELRPVLDGITPTGIISLSFEDHRVWNPFDDICLYIGYMKWGGTIVPYFFGRCIRLFGYRKHVSPPPPDYLIDDIGADWMRYHSSVLD